jgi:hypothetical protein
MTDSETGVAQLIGDEEPEEMDGGDLVEEWLSIAHALDGPEYVGELDELEPAWERRGDLWREMKSRTDAEEPECPECGGREWHQTAGNPMRCGDCGIELGQPHMDTIDAVNEYWEEVRSLGGAVEV